MIIFILLAGIITGTILVCVKKNEYPIDKLINR